MNKTVNILATLVMILLVATLFVYLYPAVPVALQSIITNAFTGASGALFLALHSAPVQNETNNTKNNTLVVEPSQLSKDKQHE